MANFNPYFKRFMYFFIYVCGGCLCLIEVCAQMCMKCQWRPEEGVVFVEKELPDISAENPT